MERLRNIFKQFSRADWILISSLSLLLLVGISVAGVLAYYYDRAWPGVMIAGVDVGGMRKDEITQKLTTIASDNTRLSVGHETYEDDFSYSELHYIPNITQTALAAVKAGKNLLSGEASDVLIHGIDLPIIYSIEEQQLQVVIDRIEDKIRIDEVYPEVQVDVDGNVTVIRGRKGQSLDTVQLRADIANRLAWNSDVPIELQVNVIDPTVSEADAAVAARRAQELLDTKVVFELDDVELERDGRLLASLIGVGPSRFNETAVDGMIQILSEEVNRPAENAIFEFDEETKRVKEFRAEILGRQVQTDALRDDLLMSLDLLESEATSTAVLSLPITTVAPEIDVADVNDLGIVELIGVGESYFRGSIPGRVHNIALAASRLNGALIPPGEEISFNQLVGEISGATGYQSSYVIQGGKTVLGDGGGVCQVSSTLFRAALNTGLPITERRAHSYRVGYYEQESYPGFDATIYSPSVDFRAINDTPGYVLIETIFDKENWHLTFKIYGTSDGRIAEISNQRIWGVVPPPEPLYQDDPTLAPGVVKQIEHAAWGAKAAFDWKVTRDGEVLQERTFTSSFRPWQAVYLRGV